MDDMRTTLTIDDDLLSAARCLSRVRAKPLGKIISELAKRGLTTTSRVGKQAGSGFPVFRISSHAAPISLEEVKKGEDEA
jgi:hypothetical protein